MSKEMEHCLKCKNRDTRTCAECDSGSLWVETKDSFYLIISAVMFGCGLGGVIAAIYAFMQH